MSHAGFYSNATLKMTFRNLKCITGNFRGHSVRAAEGGEMVLMSREQVRVEVTAAEVSKGVGRGERESVKATEEPEEKPREKTP